MAKKATRTAHSSKPLGRQRKLDRYSPARERAGILSGGRQGHLGTDGWQKTNLPAPDGRFLSFATRERGPLWLGQGNESQERRGLLDQRQEKKHLRTGDQSLARY